MNETDRMAWWHEAKLGMFVHWGCYSTLARGEQVILRDHMPLDEYVKIADDFQPADGWAEGIADQAERMGANYVVLTTRHHDGYCLFDTGTDDFNAAKTGPGRDLIAEYVEAMRKRGLKVGFYYSVVNWRWHAQWDPVKYADELPRIVEQFHEQVTELMTNYGKIDILWYDVSAVPGGGSPGDSGCQHQPVGQSSAEFYQSETLNAKVRELQPHILINNRSGTPEDFGTPEQQIKAEGDGRAWEACMTRNFAPNWANVHCSVADKTTGQILHNLINATRRGGNFLFNIGPDEKGRVLDRDRQSLDELGAWLGRNGEAVFGTRPDPITNGEGQGACYHYGMFTNKGTTAYLTFFYYPRDSMILSKVGGSLKSAKILGTGQELTVEPLRNQRYKISGLPREIPDDLAAVLKLEFEEEPYTLEWSGAEWLDGEL